MLNGAPDLRLTLLRKTKTEPSGVSGSADHASGVVLNTPRMQKAQLACCQILLAMVKIDQFTSHQIEGHGVDREISASEIGLEGACSHHGVLSWGGVVLLSRRGQIQRYAIKLKRDSAKRSVLLHCCEAIWATTSSQLSGERCCISFYHPIQISKTAPSTAKALMQ